MEYRTQPAHTWRRKALGLAASLLIPATAAAETTLDRIVDEKTIRVAVANEQPYGYIDSDGNLTGEAPTVAREILRRIEPDIRMEGEAVDWSQLIPSLQEGAVDVVAAGMFITPARCKEVTFTDPTYVVGESFLVESGNPEELSDYHSVSENPDAKVALVAGTVEYNFAMHAGIPAERAILYRDFTRAVDALEAGDVDAVGLTSLTARSLARRVGDGRFEATPQFYPVIDGEEQKGYGAFAFRKGDEAIVEAFNRELDEFIGSDEHWAMVEEFGFAPDMEPDMSAEQLCNGDA
ncbi:MAG: ectoine/hydroxyectoine ABC transporter substrate-binding protein EhuB [Halofilum sp. (in: g-proteobacteria)]|nr:ectoine/hydroxyectoine ABC transporter substrate-binding protein EhuB [Halofilum sp. (in: g-proteobacteria)]